MRNKPMLAALIAAAFLLENVLVVMLFDSIHGIAADNSSNRVLTRSSDRPRPNEVIRYTKDPSNEALLSQTGADVPYCSAAGCDPTGDHLLAHAYLKTTTTGRSDAQSVGAAFDFINARGRIPRWSARTRFSNNATNEPPPAPPSVVMTGAAFDAKIYHNRRADCLSSPTGDGPTGVGTAIVDGTCRWDYVGAGLNSGGTGVSISTRSVAGGGNQWGFVTDSVVDRNFGDGEVYGQEFDCTNNNKDSFAGSKFGFTCLYMGGNSLFPGLAAIYLDSSAQNRADGFGYHYGIYVNGQPKTPGSVVEDGAVVDASNSRHSLWGLAGRAHAAFIQDDSGSESILKATNSHSGIGIDLSAASFSSKVAVKVANDIVISQGNLRLAQYKVEEAPPCDGSAQGAMIILVDLRGQTTYRSTRYQGGGAIASPAFCNGSAWELH